MSETGVFFPPLSILEQWASHLSLIGPIGAGESPSGPAVTRHNNIKVEQRELKGKKKKTELQSAN